MDITPHFRSHPDCTVDPIRACPYSHTYVHLTRLFYGSLYPTLFQTPRLWFPGAFGLTVIFWKSIAHTASDLLLLTPQLSRWVSFSSWSPAADRRRTPLFRRPGCKRGRRAYRTAVLMGHSFTRHIKLPDSPDHDSLRWQPVRQYASDSGHQLSKI